MKKIFGKCFMVAAMVAAVGTVSSCKDYNDEIIADYRGEDDELKKSLEEQIAQLKEQHEADIEAAKAERDRIEGELDAHVADAEAKYATKAELEAAKTELEAANAALKTELEAADAAMKVELQGKINELQNKIDGINTELGNLNTKIDQVKTDLEAKIAALAQCNCDIAKLEKVVTDLAALSTKVNNLEDELKKAATKDELNNYATTAQLKALQDIVDGLVSCGCGDLLSKVTAIEGQLSSFATLTDLANLRTQVESDSARIDALQQAIAQIKECTQCDSLAAALKALEDKHAAEIAVIEENMANLYEKIVLNEELAKQYTDDAIAALKDYVVPAIGGLEGLLNQVRLDVEALKPLQAAVAELQVAVAANTTAINNLTTKVENLEEAIEQRISSVNIQGAYSPVIGYFNMPMGIKSNIVAAYYGEFATGETEINFPFVYSSSMLNGEMNDLNDLKASLGYEGETIDELNDGKAGKIYLTINPTEVNLEGVEFALVNSLGENAPVELTVQPSEDKLSFGYTRAGGVALYEAVAKITDTEATDFSLNVADYKEVFRDLKDGGSVNLSLIAEALYGTFNEIADANAVSAAWTDAMGHSHTVLSNYDIAALSVNPLSFNFMKDVTVETVPGYEKACQVIDNIVNRVKIDISFGNIENIDVRVERIDIDEDKFKIDLSDITINGIKAEITQNELDGKLYVTVDGERVEVEVSESIEVEVNEQHVSLNYNFDEMVDEIKKVEDYDNDQVDEIERVVEQANNALAQIRETEEKINNSIEDAKQNVASKLISYLDKLNNYVSGVLSSVNAKLQPVLLVSADKDFALLSQSETRPVEVSGELTLVPTTYSGELLAPAYKKYVAITAVNGSTDNLAAANAAAGENLNKVLDGDVREITFKGEAGNTYEITYSALDYAGFVVNTKYYVTVK